MNNRRAILEFGIAAGGFGLLLAVWMSVRLIFNHIGEAKIILWQNVIGMPLGLSAAILYDRAWNMYHALKPNHGKRR